MEQVFLSRRNLLTLLSKLDRKKAGEQTAYKGLRRSCGAEATVFYSTGFSGAHGVFQNLGSRFA